jgi:hypothetical protein
VFLGLKTWKGWRGCVLLLLIWEASRLVSKNAGPEGSHFVFFCLSGYRFLALQGCHVSVLSLSVIFTLDCKRPITHIDQSSLAHF